MMYDYLIVGHGIAGAVLSQRLFAKGKKILVIDTPEQNQSSVVAAGLYNPITGRKMVKTWQADLLFPELLAFYQQLEQMLKVRFFHPIGMYRPFRTNEDQNDWEGRQTDNAYKSYIATKKSRYSSHLLNDEFGGLYLYQAGYVDVVAMLDANKKFLVDKGSYREIMFREDKLINKKEHFSFESLEFKRVVFCNGISAQHGKWFGWLPFAPVKGELLEMTLNHLPSTVYNRGVFVVPQKDGTVRVGSTYKKSFVDTIPSKKGRQELEKKIQTLYIGEYQINGAKAGIRPATKDRRPLVGEHPTVQNMYIFNGFGSKGISYTPFFSKQLVDHFEHNGIIDEEVNIDRYSSLFEAKKKKYEIEMRYCSVVYFTRWCILCTTAQKRIWAQ